MLKTILFTTALLSLNTACASEPNACKIADKMSALAPPVKMISSFTGVDPSSLEKLHTYTLSYANGDNAYMEQKFCSMYNFKVTYNLKTIDQNSFTTGLNNIGTLIDSLNQDYQLKAPLPMLIDMNMNQRKLSISESFQFDLPPQAANSSEHIEHNISFLPSNKKNGFSGEITFYFNVGGE